MIRYVFFIYFFLFIKPVFSQPNIFLGKVKSIEEKIIYLEKTKLKKPKKGEGLISYNDDYGHNGFAGPDITLKQAEKFWFNIPYVQYLNYKKELGQNGKSLKESWYNKDGTLRFNYLYTYDAADSGLLTSIKMTSDDDFFRDYRYHYYEGKVLTEFVYQYDGSLQYKTYRFDSLLRVSEVWYFDDYGFSNNEKYVYSGNVIQKYCGGLLTINSKENDSIRNSINNLNVALTPCRKFIYDSSNNLILELGGDGSSGDSIMYKYNINNKLVSRIGISKSGYTQREYNFYNDDGQLTTNIWQNDTVKYFYNGSQIERVEYKSRDYKALINYTEILDKFGNWVERAKAINGKKLYLWKRKIKYF